LEQKTASTLPHYLQHVSLSSANASANALSATGAATAAGGKPLAK
jgi:hypothetical protein